MKPLMMPCRIGGITIKNRVVMTAANLGWCYGGYVTDKVVSFYQKRAEGEVGLIIAGAAGVDPVRVNKVGMMQVYDDLDSFIEKCDYDVRCFGYDPYNAKEFVERWATENGPFGIEKVIQGVKTESVPLGELKKLAGERLLLFDEQLMSFAMGNCVVMEDTNGNRKLFKKRHEQKIDAVAAMMDAWVAYKLNKESFD